MTDKITTQPAVGQVVRVRTHTYLVEDVSLTSGLGTTIRLACLDDDAQGQELEIVWEFELDTEILDLEAWQALGCKGFDNLKRSKVTEENFTLES